MANATTVMNQKGRVDDGTDQGNLIFDANRYCDDELTESKSVKIKFVRCPLCSKEKRMVSGVWHIPFNYRVALVRNVPQEAE